MGAKMKDGDTMVYLKNLLLAVTKLSEECNADISLYTTKDGKYGFVNVGDYGISFLDKEEVVYSHRPQGGPLVYGICPQEARFCREPENGREKNRHREEETSCQQYI